MAVTNHYLGTVDEGDALVTLPIEGDPGEPYLPMTAEIKLWGNQMPAFLPGLQAGLVAAGATLANGKVVESAADVVMWCLERLASAVA